MLSVFTEFWVYFHIAPESWVWFSIGTCQNFWPGFHGFLGTSSPSMFRVILLHYLVAQKDGTSMSFWTTFLTMFLDHRKLNSKNMIKTGGAGTQIVARMPTTG